jgi:hypothetical protein
MQAATLEMFGISLLQSRMASPVHICCASAVKAKPDVDGPVTDMAAANRMAVRLVRSDVIGSPNIQRLKPLQRGHPCGLRCRLRAFDSRFAGCRSSGFTTQNVQRHPHEV